MDPGKTTDLLDFRDHVTRVVSHERSQRRHALSPKQDESMRNRAFRATRISTGVDFGRKSERMRPRFIRRQGEMLRSAIVEINAEKYYLTDKVESRVNESRDAHERRSPLWSGVS